LPQDLSKGCLSILGTWKLTSLRRDDDDDGGSGSDGDGDRDYIMAAAVFCYLISGVTH
jgi:hypothetical protein